MIVRWLVGTGSDDASVRSGDLGARLGHALLPLGGAGAALHAVLVPDGVRLARAAPQNNRRREELHRPGTGARTR